ncbi:MAG: glycosyltransferase family 2 protein [Nitrospirota bacterium]|nr:glycosyltransferase family 2 protein [Nitrospirota bacterium]
MNDISIIIPIYNESKTLKPLIDAIVAQTLLPREIIFVDSGSSDDSINIITNYANTADSLLSIRTLLNTGGLPGGNRNKGIQEACSNWIAFLDAGLVPEKTWLENLMNYARSNMQNAVYGLCQFDADMAFQKAVCAISYGCGAFHPALPASLFHRSVFESAGLFREDLRATEDIVWLKKFELIYGPRQVCNSALVYYRHFPTSAYQLMSKWWSYEKSAIRSGIVSAKILWFSLMLLAFIVTIIIYFPLMSISLLASGITIRGIVSPMLRSRHWQWWGSTPYVTLIAIGACFARDMTKLIARAYYLFQMQSDNLSRRERA